MSSNGHVAQSVTPSALLGGSDINVQPASAGHAHSNSLVPIGNSNNIWSPASVSPGASSDGNSHVAGMTGYPGTSINNNTSYSAAAVANAAHSPYGLSNSSHLTGGSYGQGYPSSHSYFGTMEASYLPSMPFPSTTGHGANDMSMVGPNSHIGHYSSAQAHGANHAQFMSQSYPYHHSTASSYPSVSECIDYKDQAQGWKFQVL